MSQVIGIDVSKATVDVQVGTSKQRGQHARFATTETGLQQMHAWLCQQGAQGGHACLEATGTYSDPVALFSHQQGYQVSVVNPARVHAFRQSEGISTKTDRLDAWILACFCQQKQPALWQPPSPEQQQLKVLVARLDDLLQMQQQERNRLENQRLDPQSRQEIQEHLAYLAERLTGIKKRMEALSKEQTQLKEDEARLCSIVGIGQLSALRLLSVLGEPGTFVSARAFASYSGVTPTEHQSGTSVHAPSQMRRAGHREIRRWLYMCALVFLRRDPACQQWFQQLLARGKCKMQAVVAVMRKLSHIIYGVFTSQQDYDRAKAFPLWLPEQALAA